MQMPPAAKTLAIFFSRGAFGDCARHSILSALEDPRVGRIRVYSDSDTLPTLDEPNWKCGCGVDHGAQLKDPPRAAAAAAENLERIAVDVTDEEQVAKLDLDGVDAVISGLGNRQMFLGDRVGREGTKNVAALMKEKHIDRLVMMSSMGVDSNVSKDHPCMEWRWEGKIMTALFNTICRREYADLVGAENEAKASDLNYLVVRPVGLGEDVSPVGEYFLQKKKYEDALGPNMAKMDVGLFLVEQALAPTIEKGAVVIGADPKNAYKKFE